MAVIGYIRKHSAIAVILVGFSLVAFLVGPDVVDWATNALGYSRGPRSVREIGAINGQSFSVVEFEARALKNAEQTKINNQKADLTSEEIFNLKNQTWNQKVNEVIMDEEYENLGLSISESEMIDQLRGVNPHRLIKQYFVNEDGQYDPNVVVQYMQNLNQISPTDRQQWESFKEYVYADRLNTKYQSLIASAYYIPKALAEMEYKNSADIVEFRYVGPKYVDIPDSLVAESSEEQYKAYYEETKHRFTQDESRDIDFVVFNILPSDEDLVETEERAMKIFNDWTSASKPGDYVNNVPGNLYDSLWYGPGELSVFIDSVMFNEEIGAYVEPFKEAKAWHMARLMDRQVRPDSASAEHVLIAYNGAYRADPAIARTKAEAKALADSIYNVLRADVTKLPAIAQELSDDGSAVNNAGNLGWFKDGQMVYSFNKAAILGDVNDIVVTETPFGYHVIHVTGQNEAKERVRVAQIEIPIEYSSKTYDDYYGIAARFAGENNTREKFDQAVIDQGLEKREGHYLRTMQLNLPTFTNTRQIIRWAYSDDREEGDVSPLFDIGGQFIVATYLGGREAGDIPYDQMKERLINNLKNDRKADLIIERMKAVGTDDIYAIAREFNIEVDTIKSITFGSRNFPGYGTEHDVLGRVFAFNEGENTGIIKGNAGVFVIEVDKVSEAPELSVYDSYTMQKFTEFRQRVTNNFPYNAMEKNADITDNRKYFY